MNYKRFFILALLIAHCSLLTVFGQQAIIQEFTGTVEIQKAGTTAWEPVTQGQTISVNTLISTGFRSSALVRIGSTLLTVRPLTRMSITELGSREGTETLNVALQAGRVRADINPPAGTRTSGKIIAPVATASTRGTVFEVDTFRLWVIEGAIEYSGVSGSPVIVDAGRRSYVNEQTGRAALPLETYIADLRPDLPIASELVSSTGRSGQGSNALDLEAIAEFQ